MDDLIKYGLIAGGIFLIWKQVGSAPAAPVNVPAQSVALTPAMADLVTLNNTTASQLLAVAKAGGLLPANQLFTPSQWNFYLNQITGISPDLAKYLGGDATQVVPLGTYWAAVGQWAVDNLHAEQAANAATAAAATGVSGLSGLRGMSGLGCGNETLNGLGQAAAPVSVPAGRYDFTEIGWA